MYYGLSMANQGLYDTVYTMKIPLGGFMVYLLN